MMLNTQTVRFIKTETVKPEAQTFVAEVEG
jgi:hypothetical protein